MDEKLKSIIEEEAQKLLKELDIEASLTLQESEDGINIVLDSEENALLIGKHGNTLSSLEFIIALIIAKKTGEFKRIILEIGDYRKEREDYLKNLATRLKEEVLEQNTEKSIRGLKAWERRFIHLLMQEEDGVATQSRGEGRDRVLVLMKK